MCKSKLTFNGKRVLSSTDSRNLLSDLYEVHKVQLHDNIDVYSQSINESMDGVYMNRKQCLHEKN